MAKPAHILVVDDESNCAWALAYLLTHKGYRVSTAGDGLAALELFAADPADVVVTDLRMPHCDGTELIRRLRRDTTNLPIIVMTGYVPFGEETTIDDEQLVVMKKPVDVKVLLETLQEMIGTAGRRLPL
ncbi:MAG: response regulator [Rhodospirillales bacterium]|nr:response regulator [Rhodospirillales bacterium]